MQKPHRRPISLLIIAGWLLTISLPSGGPVLAETGARTVDLPVTSCQFANTSQRGPDVMQVELAGGAMVEKLKGEAALTHLYNVFSRKPEAFKAARKALEARGFKPTQHVYVERTVRLASNRFSKPGASVTPAQDYSEQSSEGEIIFWSWDDGDDNTWEGSVYVEVYSNGDASTWEGQIDASNENHEWIYNLKTWSGGPGGGGPRPVGLEAPPLPSPSPPQPTLAAWPPPSAGPGSMYTPVGWLEWAQCWRMCVVGGCTAVAITCIRSGPLWPGCFGFGCVGLEVGCAISCYLAK